MWISAVIFPTFSSHDFCFSRAFHILFTWFSHTYSGLVVRNSTRPVNTSLSQLLTHMYSEGSGTGILDILGLTDGSQDSPSGNQQPRPKNPHYTCVLFCPRIIFHWRNVTAYIKTWLLRIFQEMFLKCFMALFRMKRMKGSAKTTTSLFKPSQGLMAYALSRIANVH